MGIKEISSKLYDRLVRTYIYASCLCTIGGAGNSVANTENFNEAFGNAFWNQAEMSVPISILYPFVIDQLSKTKHPRLYANIYQGALAMGFMAWHYYTGTENPIETVIPMSVVATSLVNKEVSKTLEDKVQ
jgi:hypothetical protein